MIGFRSIAVLLVLVIIACVGCASPAPPTNVQQQSQQEDKQAKEVTRIEFAVFGKLKDKMKGRKGGNEPTQDCTGDQCYTDRRPNAYPTQVTPSDNGGILAAMGTLGIGLCLVLFGGAFLITKHLRDT